MSREPAAATATPPARPGRAHLLLIVNPRASRLRPRELEAVGDALRATFGVSTVRTEGPGHATQLAREAADGGYDAVAVVGGDGTGSEAAAGLMGSETPMACLPAGCTNVFARSIGTLRDPVAAARRLAARPLAPRSIDLGTVNGRPFLSASGIGFSASMSAAADRAPDRKARLGQLHFTVTGLSELGSRYLRRPPRMRIEVEGRSAHAITAIIQNSHVLTYFGPREITVCEGAGYETGSLSLTLLRRAGPRDVPSVVARLVTGSASAVTAHPQAESLPDLREAVVYADDDDAPLPLEADGEYLGLHRRIAYGVAPAALRVLA